MMHADSSVRWRRFFFALGLIAALGASRFFLSQSQATAAEHRLFSRRLDDRAPREYSMAANMLGGFRGLVVMGLWIRAQNLKNEGKFYEMVDLYRAITRLQPSHAAAWSFQSWDMAYNISVQFSHDPEDRVFWVFRGIDLIRKDGIRVHPESAALYYQLGWLFHHKVGFQSDDAHADYKRFLRKEVESVIAGIPPDDFAVYAEVATLLERYPKREDFIVEPEAAALAASVKAAGFDLFDDARAVLGRPKGLEELMAGPKAIALVRRAGLWRLGRRLRSELGMEPARMHALCVKFGPIDWSLPEAQALYWAWFAEEIRARDRPGDPEMRFLYLINHSLMRLVYTSEAIMTEQGQLFFVPDYRFLEPTIQFMNGRLQETAKLNVERAQRGQEAIPDASVREGFGNFLINMALNAFLDEKSELARRLVRLHFEVNPRAERRGMPYKDFIVATLRDRLDTMDIDRLLALINISYVRSCRLLLKGDRAGFLKRGRWIEKLHQMAQAQTRQVKVEGAVDRSRRVIPSLRDLKRSILRRIAERKVRDISEPKDVKRMFKVLTGIDRPLTAQVRDDMKRLPPK